MILAPRFDSEVPDPNLGTPVLEPQIGGTSRAPNRARRFTT
jgi:hypothetical protein